MRMATTSSRGFKTPYEMIKGEQPNISHLRPFWCKSYVTAPKSKRKWLKKKGMANIRGETGRFLGFQGIFSTTPRVMLDGDRLVHNRNTTYDITDYEKVPKRSKTVRFADESIMDVGVSLPGEEATSSMGYPETPSAPTYKMQNDLICGNNAAQDHQDEGQTNPLFGTQDVEVEISPISGLSELSSPAPLVSTLVEPPYTLEEFHSKINGRAHDLRLSIEGDDMHANYLHRLMDIGH